MTDHAHRECGPLYDLVPERGADINSHAAESHTALHFSIQNNGGIMNFTYLLGLGADPKISDHKKRNCVHYAIMWNRPSILTLLLTSGANYSSTNNRNSTILHYATTYSDTATLKALATYTLRGIDTESEDAEGNTAMVLATKREGTTPDWMALSIDLIDCIFWSDPAVQKLQGNMESGLLDSEGSGRYEDALEEKTIILDT